MGINLTQIHHTLGIEGDDIRLRENAYEKPNQESDQLDHEPDKNDILDEGISVPKKVHRFYFVKFWPHQEPSSESKVEKAEDLIRKLNHQEVQIRKRLEIESYRSWEFRRALQDLCHGNSRLASLGYVIDLKRGELKRLQLVLDRLCFANQAFQARATESCLLSGDKLDSHRLQLQMLHSCKSLAEEKQLMRDIKASQRRGEDHMHSTISMEELDWSADWKSSENYYAKTNIGLANCDGDHNRKKIKDLKLRVDKYVYNNAVKGNIWNSFGLKQAIINKLKIIGNDIDTLEKKQSELLRKYAYIEKKMQTSVKVRDSLYKRLTDMQQRKKEACESILKQREGYDKENACYYENRFLLSKALALASKIDVAALEKLSQTEGEKFMSEWNKSKAFRDDYEKRVSPSLSSRQLSSDGRMRNLGHDEEPLVLASPTIFKREAAFTNEELKCLMKDVEDPPGYRLHYW
ncbi:Proton pump-interactor [Trema orientale]|uniref:Proton pump-interactor n=1 Tax=Trema orientale TaxID=63057 RepID=A0A2P5DNL9_TREOI|nr:Proton pump-interactor [Trema orientale]